MTTLAWIIVLICVAIAAYLDGCHKGQKEESKNPKCIQVGQIPYNPFKIGNYIEGERQIFRPITKPSEDLYQKQSNEIARLEDQVRLNVKNTERYFNRWTEENKRCLGLLSTITGLEYQNKDLKNRLKEVKEVKAKYFEAIEQWKDNGEKYAIRTKELEASNNRLFADWRKEVLNNEANETRIKELEAALARAEAVNRSYAKPFADGGLVKGSIKPQNVQL